MLQGHSAVRSLPFLKPCMGHQNDFAVKEKSSKSLSFTPVSLYAVTPFHGRFPHDSVSTPHRQILDRRADNSLITGLTTDRNRLWDYQMQYYLFVWSASINFATFYPLNSGAGARVFSFLWPLYQLQYCYSLKGCIACPSEWIISLLLNELVVFKKKICSLFSPLSIIFLWTQSCW